MQGLVRQIVGSNSRNLYRMGGTAISLSASQNGFYVLKLYTQDEASKEVGEEKLLGISFCLVLLYFCEFMKTYSTKKYSMRLCNRVFQKRFNRPYVKKSQNDGIAILDFRLIT